MDRTSRARQPQVERMESRTLLSGSPLHLRGAAHVEWIYTTSPDGSDVISLKGFGQIGPLGLSRVSGSMSFLTAPAPGVNSFIPYNGTINLSNRHGSVTVRVVHETNDPKNLVHYDITAGTGTYQDASGSGTITQITLSRALSARLFSEARSGHKPTIPPSFRFSG